jgi:hypothetical protein
MRRVAQRPDDGGSTSGTFVSFSEATRSKIPKGNTLQKNNKLNPAEFKCCPENKTQVPLVGWQRHLPGTRTTYLSTHAHTYIQLIYNQDLQDTK